jgi:hypothetical protein
MERSTGWEVGISETDLPSLNTARLKRWQYDPTEMNRDFFDPTPEKQRLLLQYSRNRVMHIGFHPTCSRIAELWRNLESKSARRSQSPLQFLPCFHARCVPCGFHAGQSRLTPTNSFTN